MEFKPCRTESQSNLPHKRMDVPMKKDCLTFNHFPSYEASFRPVILTSLRFFFCDLAQVERTWGQPPGVPRPSGIRGHCFISRIPCPTYLHDSRLVPEASVLRPRKAGHGVPVLLLQIPQARRGHSAKRTDGGHTAYISLRNSLLQCACRAAQLS